MVATELSTTLLLVVGVLSVVFSNAERRFDRLALGVCIASAAGVLVVMNVPDVPRQVFQVVSVVGFAVTVVAFLAILADRYQDRNGQLG